MKWFKHFSTARNDEKIARLEDKTGIEGYGFYFKMLEIVAEVIDETDKHEVTYSLSRWGRQTNITSKKFLFLCQCCSDVGLMNVQRHDDNVTVKIANLLKFRDNHTKNLQATNKQDKEVDKDKDENKINNIIITIPYQEIVNRYAINLPFLPQVTKLTEARKRALKSRWLKDGYQDLEFWNNFFFHVSESDFLTGKTTKWQCDFDWLIKEQNFLKVIEGKYLNRVEMEGDPF